MILIRETKRFCSKGISIIEAAIALLVISLALVPVIKMMGGQGGNTTASQTNKESAQELSNMNTLMEMAHAGDTEAGIPQMPLPGQSLSPTGTREGKTYTWTLRGLPAAGNNASVPPESQNRLATTTLKVSGSGRRDLYLSTNIVRMAQSYPAPPEVPLPTRQPPQGTGSCKYSMIMVDPFDPNQLYGYRQDISPASWETLPYGTTEDCAEVTLYPHFQYNSGIPGCSKPFSDGNTSTPDPLIEQNIDPNGIDPGSPLYKYRDLLGGCTTLNIRTVRKTPTNRDPGDLTAGQLAEYQRKLTQVHLDHYRKRYNGL